MPEAIPEYWAALRIEPDLARTDINWETRFQVYPASCQPLNFLLEPSNLPLLFLGLLLSSVQLLHEN